MAPATTSLPWTRAIWTTCGAVLAIPPPLPLLDFARNGTERDVPDPYYTGNFDYVYRLVEDGCRGLLAHIREEENFVAPHAC
jgi:protein-tyrosine-phosphatase